jgi:hypothetical protein
MGNNRYETYQSIASNLKLQAAELLQEAEEFENLAYKFDNRPRRPLSPIEQNLMNDLMAHVLNVYAPSQPAPSPTSEGSAE